MKKSVLFPVALILVSIILAVICYAVLPDTVITQISLGGSATTMPKVNAILLPLLISIGGAILGMKTGKESDKENAESEKNPSKSKSRYLVVSVVGILIYFIMLFVNLAL